MQGEIEELVKLRREQVPIIFGKEFDIPSPSRQVIRLYNRVKENFDLFYAPRIKAVYATLEEEQTRQHYPGLTDRAAIFTHDFDSEFEDDAGFLTGTWILLENTGKPMGRGKVKPYQNDQFEPIFEEYYDKGLYGWYETGRKNKTEKGSRCGFELPLVMEEMFPRIARKLGIEVEQLRYPTMPEYYLFEQTVFPEWKKSHIREWTSTKLWFDYDGRRCLHYLIRKYFGDGRFDYYFTDKVQGVGGSDAVSPDLGLRFVIDLEKSNVMEITFGWTEV